jgi:hypothetical protein
MTNFKALLASWGRSFLAGLIACYLAGVTDPKMLLSAGIGAVAPVILRWLNPNDGEFGKVNVKENNEH